MAHDEDFAGMLRDAMKDAGIGSAIELQAELERRGCTVHYNSCLAWLRGSYAPKGPTLHALMEALRLQQPQRESMAYLASRPKRLSLAPVAP
jgi:hypothetical protein